MSYRNPICLGDRVALAPHLDLWMAGVRFGEVEKIQTHPSGARMYFVSCNRRTNLWLTGSDLLGAVGPMKQRDRAEEAEYRFAEPCCPTAAAAAARLCACGGDDQ